MPCPEEKDSMIIEMVGSILRCFANYQKSCIMTFVVVVFYNGMRSAKWMLGRLFDHLQF